MNRTGGGERRRSLSPSLLVECVEPHLLFLYVFHHAVDALLGGDVTAVDQAVGCGVEVFPAVVIQKTLEASINHRFNYHYSHLVGHPIPPPRPRSS